jgi:hypothetical protein
MSAPIFAAADEETYDLLTAVANPHPIIGADAQTAFLAACRRDAMAHDGEVSVNRVRELLADADIPPQRYSALWSANTGRGKAMERSVRWETIRGSGRTGKNDGKPVRYRIWIGEDA